MDQDKIRLMRGASYLLPDPGGEVVRELLDEIERLQNGIPEAPEPGGRLRLFNADTGMYYVQGQGFAAECRRKATLLDSAKRAAVRFSYAGMTRKQKRGLVAWFVLVISVATPCALAFALALILQTPNLAIAVSHYYGALGCAALVAVLLALLSRLFAWATAPSSERIKRAAICYNGRVYEGRRHCEIGQAMIKGGVCEAPYPGGKAQGFVTDEGRFVSRAEALEIAIDAGQVQKGKTIQRRELFSEDLLV